MHVRSKVQILVADDFEHFRQSISLMLQDMPELQVVCEVSDGLEAVRKAQELQPDLILLDLGLPKLNGMEAARRIRKLSPGSRILFVSQESSPAVAQEAFDTGAKGYVVKSDAGRELLPAVRTVLNGGVFVSSSLAGHAYVSSTSERSVGHSQIKEAPAPQDVAVTRHHEVAFYSDDASLVNGFGRFIESALSKGSAVIVIASESRRASLIQRLRADGVRVGDAIAEGSYISLDVAGMVSTLMAGDLLDPVRFRKLMGDLIARAARTAKGEHRRVVMCGERAPALLAEGKAEAAIQFEHLCHEILRRYDMDILCGYLSKGFRDTTESPPYGESVPGTQPHMQVE